MPVRAVAPIKERPYCFRHTSHPSVVAAIKALRCLHDMKEVVAHRLL
jgi:hypothetical protein